jgi:membrane associated rhomboid family serine protease
MYCKSESPGVQEFVMTNLRTSVAAIYEGQYHTLVTSIFCHTSAIHCAINLLMLGAFRKTQPLTALEVRTCIVKVTQGGAMHTLITTGA